MARLPATTGTGAVADRIRERRGGVLRPIDEMLLHSPQLADGWNTLLGAIRQRITLPADLRELIIMRVGALNGAEYEWNAHLADSRAAGLSEAAIAALREEGGASSPALTADQAAVLAYTDAMTKDVHVPASLFADLVGRFSAAEILEITTVVAAYNMVSRFVVALDVRALDG